MQKTRGVLMVIAAAIAFWKAWHIHRSFFGTRNQLWIACALGVVALAMGLWHLLQKTESRPKK